MSLNLNQDYEMCEELPKETPTDNEIIETPKRKLSPQKFILPIETENNTSVDEKITENLNDFRLENEKCRTEKLKKEKKDIMGVMVTIKRKISDIQIQEEELIREVKICLIHEDSWRKNMFCCCHIVPCKLLCLVHCISAGIRQFSADADNFSCFLNVCESDTDI